MRSLLIGVPPSFPPPKEFPGWRVGCFLTPPSAEAVRVTRRSSRSRSPRSSAAPATTSSTSRTSASRGFDFALDQVFKMTERRFQVARRLIKNKPWDFFMMVDIGPDRLHHVFWQYFDPRHPLYEPGNKFETAFQDYYRFLDARGRLAAGGPARRRHHDRDVATTAPAR